MLKNCSFGIKQQLLTPLLYWNLICKLIPTCSTWYNIMWYSLSMTVHVTCSRSDFLLVQWFPTGTLISYWYTVSYWYTDFLLVHCFLLVHFPTGTLISYWYTDFLLVHCFLLVHFPTGTLISTTNKTDHHNAVNPVFSDLPREYWNMVT
jgi:hypothetical protein